MLCSCMYWKIHILEFEQMYSCQFLSKLFVNSIQTQISNMYVIIFKLIWSLKIFTEVAQSCLTLCDPMDCSSQVALSMGSSMQECWGGLPFPSPGDLPHPGIKPESPALHTSSLLSEPQGKPFITLQEFPTDSKQKNSIGKFTYTESEYY